MLFVTCSLYSLIIIGPFKLFCKSVAVIYEISKSFSISSLTFSYVTPTDFSSGNL